MFRNAHFERVQKMFADQFEPEGADYLYRKSMRSAPIRVTAAERDAFVAKFATDQRRLMWAIVALVVIGVAIQVMLLPSANKQERDYSAYAVVAVAIVAFVIPWRLIWNAPARALERRPTIGNERSRAETSQAMISKMSWGQLLAITIGAGLAWWSFAPGDEAWRGWHLIWMAIGMVLFGGMALRAWQKWKMGQPNQ